MWFLYYEGQLHTWFPASYDDIHPEASSGTAVFLSMVLHFGYEVKQPTTPLLNEFASSEKHSLSPLISGHILATVFVRDYIFRSATCVALYLKSKLQCVVLI